MSERGAICLVVDVDGEWLARASVHAPVLTDSIIWLLAGFVVYFGYGRRHSPAATADLAPAR